jgi:hypothetical protein
VFLICSLKNQSILRRVVIRYLNLTSLFALFVFNLQFEKTVFFKTIDSSTAILLSIC